MFSVRNISIKLVMFIGLVIWLLGQTSCVVKSEVDKSILTGIPCEPPCWQRIVPGQTMQDAAMSILTQSPYIQTNSIGWGEANDGYLAWRSNLGTSGNYLTIHDGIVKSISISLDFPLSLGQLIDRYGPPDKVLPMPTIEHKAITRVFLIYLQKGFDVVLSDFLQEPIELSKSTSVERIFYHPPASTIEELERGILKSPENIVNFYVQYSYDWIGYGPVEVIRP